MPTRYNSGLKEQMYLETVAMAKFALANGKKIPETCAKSIEDFEEKMDTPEGKKKQVTLGEIAQAHAKLAALITPTKPVVARKLVQTKEAGRLKLLFSSMGLIGQMILVSIVSLVFFITGLVLVFYFDTKPADFSATFVYFSQLILYIVAAGLGASFSALYKAEQYSTEGTFDPAHYSSYWIRFLMGLISGLVLAVIISESAFDGSDQLLTKGVARPVLALLGGFSAELFHTFLSRFVEAFKSLFKGSADGIVAAKILKIKSELENIQAQGEMKMARNLMKLQKDIGKDISHEEITKRVNELLDGLLPDVSDKDK